MKREQTATSPPPWGTGGAKLQLCAPPPVAPCLPERQACHPAAAVSAALASSLRELGQHLAELHAALKQLADLADRKLTAMRSADTEALQDCAVREGDLLREMFRGEQRRNAVLASLAQGLHLAEPRRARLMEIADRLPEPLASSLRARGVALRDLAARLQRKNRLAAGVARNLQTHLSGIFAAMAGATQESQVYGPQGKQGGTGLWPVSHRRDACATLFVDAVG